MDVRIGQEVPAGTRPLAVSHVADFYQRYPGETVTFFSRVDVSSALPRLSVRVTLPEGLTLQGYQAASIGDEVPRVITSIDSIMGREVRSLHLDWEVAGDVLPGSYEYQVSATVDPAQQDTKLKSQALASSARPDPEHPAFVERLAAQETASVAVSAKGAYLRYLPSLYMDDELMGRFLMLFESFWKPIEGQIDSLPFYLDPRMTSPDFLPWLASWFDLLLDERWPEDRKRQLLGSVAYLYRMRGTRQALTTYLEIYTGVKPEIVEHRAYNLRLGPEARLGTGIALGRQNLPHTFTVILRLPPVAGSEELTVSEEQRAYLELERRRIIARIIDAEKPAHTSYTLRIETAGGE